MAFTRGRCTNFDYCSVAESRRDVEVPVGENFVCPECGKPLRAPELVEKKSLAVPALIGGGLLLVVGGAVYLGMRMAGGTGTPSVPAPPQLAAVTPQPAPAPTPAAPKPAPAPAAPADAVLARIAAVPELSRVLGVRLASAYLESIGDTSVVAAGGADDMRVSGQRGDRKEIILIHAEPSAQGFAALAKGEVDGVLTAGRITTADKDASAALGDLTTPSAEHALALQAGAVIVNAASHLDHLTAEQVRAIFGGQITDWSRLGQAAGAVDVIVPEGASATLGGGITLAGTRVADGAAAASAVAADPRAIAVVPPQNIGAARAIPVAETGGSATSASDLGAVLRGDYPLVAHAYFYTSPAAADGFAAHIANYGLSPAGQAMLQQAGFVPATARAQSEAAAPATSSDRLRAFVSGAKRLAIDFHFQANSTNLDDKSQRDLDRVLNYIVSNHYTGANVELAGFADNQGDPAQNTAVSKKRADAVAALFARRGLAPARVAGFGGELPIADNATEAGRERNRRVEVYLRP